VAIKIKSGVSLLGLQPQTLLGISIAEACYAEKGKSMTLTSVTDHAVNRSPSSRHKSGLAFDIRILNITDPGSMRKEIAERLGEEFDCVLESDHIHIEWDPKK
jgi:hypothetical protein